MPSYAIKQLTAVNSRHFADVLIYSARSRLLISAISNNCEIIHDLELLACCFEPTTLVWGVSCNLIRILYQTLSFISAKAGHYLNIIFKQFFCNFLWRSQAN